MQKVQTIVWLASLALITVSGCAETSSSLQASNLCGEQKGGDKQWSAPELVRAGNSYLENMADSGSSGAGSAFVCYMQALQRNPEDYGAHLGLAVVSLHAARQTSAREYFNSARSHLALALAIRPFHFETIYYLAELAVLEKKHKLALEFLNPLLKAGYKKGPVHTLAGDIYQELGDSKAARLYYTIGAREGWPAATARYAQERAD